MAKTKKRKPTCPSCGAATDGHTSILDQDQTPSEGDVSVCAYCRAILVYNADLSQHEITEDELLALPARLRALLLLITEAIRKKPPLQKPRKAVR